MIAGTPAMTKTFLMRKPGAAETVFLISVAPSGMRAMRSRLSFGSMPRALPERQQQVDRALVDADRDAERLGHRIGGDIVVGRADPAAREDEIVAPRKRPDRLHDRLLAVADDPDLHQVDADIGQGVGDEADILVLGPAGEDLVADDRERRRSAHSALIFPCPRLLKDARPMH